MKKLHLLAPLFLIGVLASAGCGEQASYAPDPNAVKGMNPSANRMKELTAKAAGSWDSLSPAEQKEANDITRGNGKMSIEMSGKTNTNAAGTREGGK